MLTKNHSADRDTTPPLGGGVGQAWREAFTLLLSAAISLVALALLCLCFSHAGTVFATPDALAAYNREKDIMLYGLSLLGTVTGYFLGRTPVEVRAQAAEQANATAQHRLSETQQQAGEAIAQTNLANQARAKTEEDKADLKTTYRAGLTRLSATLAPAGPVHAASFREGGTGAIKEAAEETPQAQARRQVQELLAQVDQA